MEWVTGLAILGAGFLVMAGLIQIARAIQEAAALDRKMKRDEGEKNRERATRMADANYQLADAIRERR
jgi:hypothetical protein